MVNEAVVARIIEVLEQAGEQNNIDIVDVEVVGATKNPTVRVRIDHLDIEAQSISLDEVAAHTGWIGDLIDQIDPFPDAFTLEVSSPGLSRPLRRAKDFERFAGNTVALSTNAHEGRRRFTGELVGMEHEKVVLLCDGERYEFALDEINRCTIKPDFDFKSSSSKTKNK
ncbi:ribosome maturation factor RimP [Atopobium fossor]|uniref:ribosome maturation factor RimP n=1 Tax=Atopobium fossor TaxID=39487 RepID=UPI000405CBB7|nr:ribosome maturation factor RimP [Atopobium fossor]